MFILHVFTSDCAKGQYNGPTPKLFILITHPIENVYKFALLDGNAGSFNYTREAIVN